jgi:hypothetical protein
MVADDRPSTSGQVLAAGDTQQPRRLRRHAVSLPGATTIGVAVIAPAAGMAFVPQIVAGYTGAWHQASRH